MSKKPSEALIEIRSRIIDLLSDGVPRSATQVAQELGFQAGQPIEGTCTMISSVIANMPAKSPVRKHKEPGALSIYFIPGAKKPAAEVAEPSPPAAVIPEVSKASPHPDRINLQLTRIRDINAELQSVSEQITALESRRSELQMTHAEAHRQLDAALKE